VNISAQSITVNVNISDFKATITPTSLFEKGNQVVSYAYGSNGYYTIYTCPSGKTAYVLTMYYWALNTSTSNQRLFWVYATIRGYAKDLIWLYVLPSSQVWDMVTGGVIKLNAGDSITMYASTDVSAEVVVVVAEL
jgi:hypothetical protein